MERTKSQKMFDGLNCDQRLQPYLVIVRSTVGARTDPTKAPSIHQTIEAVVVRVLEE